MKNIDNKTIESLDRILSLNPVLFTGSGYSRGALNGNHVDIPAGDGLKELIIVNLLGYKKGNIEYQQLMDAQLPDVCTFATNEISSQKLKDYMISVYRDCTPKEYHKIIARFPWKKIYTTNIDDLIENAVESGSITVQNTSRQFSFTQAKSIEYIKLHGCVRNPDGEIVFSRRDYIDSMMKSTDYRFSSFANDMQTENFIFIGTAYDEIDLDYYLKLFEHNGNKSVQGKAFFINPSPSIIFTSKVKKAGGEIIEWTAEEFANHLTDLQSSKKYESLQNKSEIPGYVNINSLYNNCKSIINYRSNLYMGEFPEWKDIFFDWDFINPQISNIYQQVQQSVESSRTHVSVASLHGKSLSGKSTYLKRLGFLFMKDGYQVYEFIGRRLDYYYFYKKCRELPDSNIALIVDNGSFYYAAIRSLLAQFQKSSKQIVVITSSREYHHNRKRYHLSGDSYYFEYEVTGEIKPSTEENFGCFAENIIKRLDDKGYLGSLKALNEKERLDKIEKVNDVSELMFYITQSPRFRHRIISNYKSLNTFASKQTIDFLCLLAIFQKLDLPYFPLELLGMWDTSNYFNILKESDDFIKNINEVNAVELRNNVLTNTILCKKNENQKITLIRDILCLVSPQVSDTVHSFWNEIQSVLMKGKALRGKLKISNNAVKNMLTEIKNYYNDDYNYWIQVGIAEQSDGEYERALNHFRQAESISPNSYLVQNAIARNYLRQANSTKNRDEAKAFFEEGERGMLALIKSRDEFQVKAFSTHCYLFEKIKYVKRHNIVLKKKELESMYTLLKNIVERDPNDPMARHIGNVFANYIKNSTNTDKLKIKDIEELKYLRPQEDLSVDDSYRVLEDLDLS